MSITESAITLNFPDDNFFRFQDCRGYQLIENHLKEMDVCWYDSNANILYLIELKDWSIADLSESLYTEQRIWDLVKKSVDSVSMILCITLGKPHATNFTPCMSFNINSTTQLKLISIIHCKNNDRPFIASINQAYRTRFNSYAKLFDIKTFYVMTHEQASERLDWVF